MPNRNRNKFNKTRFGIIAGITVAMIFGTIFFIYNNQKTITANTILDLEQKLEEQGKLTVEQEKELEELKQVKCKDVQVPYDAQEEYTEQEPYIDTECTTTKLVYNADYTKCNFGGFFSDPEVIINVNNLDSSNGGYFSFWVGFYLKDGNKVGQEITNYIYPLSSEQFRYTAGIDKDNIDNCNYFAQVIPTRTDCEDVTKYKPVIKYRTITKYKTETVCE